MGSKGNRILLISYNETEEGLTQTGAKAPQQALLMEINMELKLALAVAKRMCDYSHPATIRSKRASPNLRMIRVANGQYLTSQDTSDAIRHWTFEEFVAEFAERRGGEKLNE